MALFCKINNHVYIGDSGPSVSVEYRASVSVIMGWNVASDFGQTVPPKRSYNYIKKSLSKKLKFILVSSGLRLHNSDIKLEIG